MDIFNWFGSLLGYLLWFLYEIVQNYGVAIILFTIVVKALVFPFSVKQQKSMASQAKVQKKVRELQKIYANDKMKQSGDADAQQNPRRELDLCLPLRGDRDHQAL